MDATALQENFLALLATLLRLKPASAKGAYIKSITVSSTMSPGLKLDIAEATRQAEGV